MASRGLTISGVVTCLAFVSAMLSASAQSVPPEEVLTLESLSLSDDDFLSGNKESGRPVALSAQLQLPPATGEPVPVVILLHGSDGPSSAVTWNWAKVLGRMGIATLRVDSYTGRGFDQIFTDQGRVGEFNNIVDAYRALDLLARDPRIDASKIAVMGFSRGGIAALYSAMTRFQDLYGPENVRFAAHLPFYPPCNFALEGDDKVGSAPIRAFHGEADDWNPLPACQAYIERLKAAGHDAEIYSYPGAYHAFDHPGSPSYNVKEDAQTSRRCKRRELDGKLLNADNGHPFTWKDPCVELGPAVQFNSAAASTAEKEVKAFLSSMFKLAN